MLTRVPSNSFRSIPTVDKHYALALGYPLKSRRARGGSKLRGRYLGRHLIIIAGIFNTGARFLVLVSGQIWLLFTLKRSAGLAYLPNISWVDLG